MEEDDEDSSPCMKAGFFEKFEEDFIKRDVSVADRWEVKKQKQHAIKKVLIDTFLEVHELVVSKNDKLNTQLSGSTLTVVLITDDNTLYTAGVGDSHAVLIKYDQILKEEVKFKKESGIEETVEIPIYSATTLTTDHKPSAPREIKRIYRCGGEVRQTRTTKGSRS